MPRLRLTQRFPFLRPLRQAQRNAFFYAGMALDQNRYAASKAAHLLPFSVYAAKSRMVNENSGFPIHYQHNKVHNLRVASAPVDHLLIYPGETFSFWQLVRNADKITPYKDGLVLVNGAIVGEYGGGLCQLSNVLFDVFLHSPFALVERWPHAVETMAPIDPGTLAGVDATVAEGWKDLKVRNDTKNTFQLSVGFDDTFMYIHLTTNRPVRYLWRPENQRLVRTEQDGVITEEAEVWRVWKDKATGEESRELLYENRCVIEYPLSPEEAAAVVRKAQNTNSRKEAAQ